MNKWLGGEKSRKSGKKVVKKWQKRPKSDFFVFFVVFSGSGGAFFRVRGAGEAKYTGFFGVFWPRAQEALPEGVTFWSLFDVFFDYNKQQEAEYRVLGVKNRPKKGQKVAKKGRFWAKKGQKVA
jgi:hypothetical protein